MAKINPRAQFSLTDKIHRLGLEGTLKEVDDNPELSPEKKERVKRIIVCGVIAIGMGYEPTPEKIIRVTNEMGNTSLESLVQAAKEALNKVGGRLQ